MPSQKQRRKSNWRLQGHVQASESWVWWIASVSTSRSAKPTGGPLLLAPMETDRSGKLLGFTGRVIYSSQNVRVRYVSRGKFGGHLWPW